MFRVFRGSSFCSLKNGSTNYTNYTKSVESTFEAKPLFSEQPSRSVLRCIEWDKHFGGVQLERKTDRNSTGVIPVKRLRVRERWA